MTLAVAMRRRARWWRACAAVSFGRMLTYRQMVLLNIVGLMFQLFLLTRIWTALYDGAGSVDGLPLDSLMVYLTLSALQGSLVAVSVNRYVQTRVRTGTVIFDLGRPASFVGQLTGFQAGETAALLLFVLPTLPVAALIGGLAAPASAGAAAGYLVTFLLGYLVNLFIGLLIGLTAFWTLEVRGTELLVRLIGQFFSGAMIPLTFFPDALRGIADALPFKFIAYIPASIYIGQIEGADVLRQIGLGAIWALALGGWCWLVWVRGYRRVVIQGG